MTDIDNDDDVFDDIFDDDDFAVDLAAGLPPEGKHMITIKMMKWSKNPDKQNSKGINVGMEFEPGHGLEFTFIWLGNDERKNRQGNAQLGAIIQAATGERPDTNVNLKNYGPYTKDDEVYFGDLEGVMCNVTVVHRKDKNTGELKPFYTFSPLDQD